MATEILAPKRTFGPGVDVELKRDADTGNIIMSMSGQALAPILVAAQIQSIDLVTSQAGYQKLIDYLLMVSQGLIRLNRIDAR